MAVPILSDIFGTKPTLPDFVPTDLGAEQIAALQANIGAEPYISELQNWYGQYVDQALARQGFDLRGILSRGTGLLGQEQALARQQLSGQIPSDVIHQIYQTGAVRGLGSGTLGSPLGEAYQGALIGQTSQQEQLMGQQTAAAAGNAAQTWANLAGMTLLNPSSYMVTPQQAVSLDQYNKSQALQLGIARANIAAAPNPIAKGLSDLVAYLTASYIGHGAAGQPPAAPGYSQLENVPQGGVGGAWAQLTGQPYQTGTGATANLQYNAPPFQTDASGNIISGGPQFSGGTFGVGGSGSPYGYDPALPGGAATQYAPGGDLFWGEQ